MMIGGLAGGGGGQKGNGGVVRNVPVYGNFIDENCAWKIAYMQRPSETQKPKMKKNKNNQTT